MSAKKGECEICGFADDSYRIEENGSVLKVCKFCHDGYLERMGLPPDADKPIEDITMTLDLTEAQTEENESEGGKIEPLSDEELAAVLKPDEKDKQVLQRVNRRARERDRREEEKEKRDDAMKAALADALKRHAGLVEEIKTGLAEFDEIAEETTKETEPSQAPSPAPETVTPVDALKAETAAEEKKIEDDLKEKVMAKKTEKKARKPEPDVLAQANPHIDDERIRITSPEVPLETDSRPKTNLDVAISEYRAGVKFLDAFKYVFHRVSYTIYLAVLVVAVTTGLFITSGWMPAVITFAAGVGAIALSFPVMWYLSIRLSTDKRAYLLRIRQQEILFNSMQTDCYRELRTKFTVLKSLEWLLAKLSVLLPLTVIVAATVAAVITAFLYQYWVFSLILFGAILAGIITYWLVKFAADMVSYKLDTERNQQVMQQTMLDILSELKK